MQLSHCSFAPGQGFEIKARSPQCPMCLAFARRLYALGRTEISSSSYEQMPRSGHNTGHEGSCLLRIHGSRFRAAAPLPYDS